MKTRIYATPAVKGLLVHPASTGRLDESGSPSKKLKRHRAKTTSISDNHAHPSEKQRRRTNVSSMSTTLAQHQNIIGLTSMADGLIENDRKHSADLYLLMKILSN